MTDYAVTVVAHVKADSAQEAVEKVKAPLAGAVEQVYVIGTMRKSRAGVEVELWGEGDE